MCTCGTARQPRGAALVICMLVMAVLLLAGTTFLTIASTESQIALNERASAQAFSLATAGIQRTMAQLNANPSYGGEANVPLGAGTFSVSVATAAGCTATSARDLVATGVVPVREGQAQAQLRVRVDQVSYPYRWAAFAAVPNQIVYNPNQTLFGADRTQSELWLNENAVTDSFDSAVGAYPGAASSGRNGSLGGNADVKLDKNTAVKGSVRAGDAIHTGTGVSVTGSQTSGVSPGSTDPGEPFPSVTPSPPAATGDLTIDNDKDRTLTAGTYSYNKMDLGNKAILTISGGPVTIYVNTIDMGNNATLAISGGPVTIYVTGKVEIKNGVTLGGHPGTQLQIVTKSSGGNLDSADFKAGNDFALYGSLYGKNTNFSLGENARLYGAIIGRTVLAKKGASIHYDEAMFDQRMCTNGKYNIVRGAWYEVIP